MKIYSTVIICLLLLCSCGQEQHTKTQFQNEKGRFKVSFPTKPKISEETNRTSLGALTIHSFKLETKDEDIKSYELNYLDLPSNLTETLDEDGIYALFNDIQRENINSNKIQSLGILNLDILGYTGREFTWNYEEEDTISKIRCYLVNNRMYLLTVNTTDEHKFNIKIAEFFDSFELMDTEPKLAKTATTKKDKRIYNISFPGATETVKTGTPTAYGNGTLTAEAYQPKLENDKNIAYSVIVLEYSEDITKTAGFNLDDYYVDMVQSSLNNRQSTLVDKREISKNGMKGIETKEQLNLGNRKILIKQWAYLKGNSLLSIQVATIPENDENDSMNDFFDSFEFFSEN